MITFITQEQQMLLVVLQFSGLAVAGTLGYLLSVVRSK